MNGDGVKGDGVKGDGVKGDEVKEAWGERAGFHTGFLARGGEKNGALARRKI